MTIRCLVLLLLTLFLSNCAEDRSRTPKLNLNHILSLVDSLETAEGKVLFVHIYAEAPSYGPVEAVGEGIACVDDAGRLMEVLEAEITENQNRRLLHFQKGLARFLLYMQRNDGLWYNFIFSDGSINRTHRNSRADLGWWAVRGLRGLASAYVTLQSEKPQDELLPGVKAALQLTLDRLSDSLKQKSAPEKPKLIKDAPDITSECLLALAKLHETGDFNLLPEIRTLSESLIESQYINPADELHGMYFCWDSLWHNWGNNQSLALLKAFQVTRDSTYLKSVRLWADHFLPFLEKNSFPNEIRLTGDNSYEIKPFPQIAYGFSSIFRGIAELAEMTGEKSYRNRAKDLFSWFTGKNPGSTVMYDESTGRCFDGINEGRQINRNSGAESTIEALLAVQCYRRFFQ